LKVTGRPSKIARRDPRCWATRGTPPSEAAPRASLPRPKPWVRRKLEIASLPCRRAPRGAVAPGISAALPPGGDEEIMRRGPADCSASTLASRTVPRSLPSTRDLWKANAGVGKDFVKLGLDEAGTTSTERPRCVRHDQMDWPTQRGKDWGQGIRRVSHSPGRGTIMRVGQLVDRNHHHPVGAAVLPAATHCCSLRLLRHRPLPGSCCSGPVHFPHGFQT